LEFDILTNFNILEIVEKFFPISNDLAVIATTIFINGQKSGG